MVQKGLPRFSVALPCWIALLGGLELLLDLLHRRRERVAQPPAAVGKGPVVVGEGGIQLAGGHRLAEGLQQRFELLLQLLLLGLEGRDRIEQRIDGASDGAEAASAGAAGITMSTAFRGQQARARQGFTVWALS